MILNVDSSSLDNLGVSDFGGLIRNFDVDWVHGFTGNIGYSNILMFEITMPRFFITWKNLSIGNEEFKYFILLWRRMFVLTT